MEEIKKSRSGIKPGYVCIKVEYQVVEKNRLGGNKRPYTVRRGQWVLPQTALERMDKAKANNEKIEIDFSSMKEKGIKFPTPEDPNRLHTHDGEKKPHRVSKYHKGNVVARKASAKEIENYWSFYHHDDSDFLNRRLHTHRPRYHAHHVSEPHEDIEEQAEHRDEKQKFEAKVHGRLKSTNWLDDPQLIIENVKMNIRGKNVPARKYSKQGIIAFVFDTTSDDVAYVYTKKDGYKKFIGKRPTVEAMNYLETIFSKDNIKKSLDELKDNIIDKVAKMSPNDPDAKKDTNIVINKFKSGDDEVVLAGKDGHYSVAINDTPIINTDEFTRAISKYYSLISGTIDAKGKDKDMALEIFGERLLQINRAIRPLIAKLGDTKSAMYLLDFDYSNIDYPFNEDEFLKAEMPRVMQISGVPLNEELGSAASETGNKPSKKSEKPLQSIDNRESSQKPIEEKGDRNIRPVSIMS